MTPAISAAGPHRLRLRMLAAAAALGALGSLTGCIQPPRRPAPTGEAHEWSGRLALQVEDAASQSFSASFELRGQPQQGSLTLFNPLGNVAASLEWQPGQAVLISGRDRRESASLDTLVQDLLGSPVPIAALFDWLDGRDAPAPGWQVDLGAIADGRLVAERHTPAPRATLRVVLNP